MPTINGKACVANGRNLLLDTKDINNLALWFGNETWTKQADKYNGLVVMQTTGDRNGLSQYVKVKTGEVYTFSVYARYASGTGASMLYWLLNANPEIGHASAQASATTKWVSLSDNWQRVSITTTITADGYIRPRIERTNNNSNILQIAGMKLETGTLATPLTPAPVDKVFSDGKLVYGRNLLTNTSDFNSNWTGQSSVSKTTEYNGHPSMVFDKSTQQLAFQNLDLGKLQNSTKYTASLWAKADNAGDKAHTELWGSIGATDFVLTTNWVHYTAVLTSASDVNTNISHSYCFFGIPDKNIGNVYIALPKLEKGSVATPYSPAPEDVM